MDAPCSTTLSEEQMSEGARSQGMPESKVAYLSRLYSLVRAGFAAGVSENFEKIMGGEPRSFEAFARSVFSAVPLALILMTV